MPVPALPTSALRRVCDPRLFAFETTAEIVLPLPSGPDVDDGPSFLGQHRALAALRFGVGMKQHGYHMYALGRHGGGRHAVVQTFLERAAQRRPTLWDWCYVHNFDEAHRPRLLRLELGQGLLLRDAMSRLVDELRAALPASLESEEYRKHRQDLEEELGRRSQAAFGALSEKARARDVGLVRTPVGLGLVPIRDGEVIPPDEFRKLSEAEQGRFKQTLEELEEELQAIVQKAPQWEREHREALRKLQHEVTRHAVGHLLDEVRASFRGVVPIQQHLDAVEKDVVENAEELLAATQGGGPEAMFGLLAGGRGESGSFRRYRVNLLVDNGHARTAPVLYEDNPTHQALVGRAEHQARFGALVTDFQMLKPGALHRANGGYLVLDAHRVLTNGFAWASLKRALHAREVRIESIEQLLSLATTTQLEPEPVPLDVKVVLIGSREVYHLLTALDPDFADLFKVAVDFDDDLPWDDEAAREYAALVATVVARQGLLPVSRAGVARLVEQSARAAGDAERLSTHHRQLTDLLDESHHLASRRDAQAIEVVDIDAAIAAQLLRNGRIAERVREETVRGTLLVATEGRVVGQINGLAVSMLAGFVFGHPSRITARVRLGKGDVVDIEREVELGGPLHSKGVLILQGFLGGRFGAERPMPLHASLVFEQSYGGVEGDSASSAELYALLSALAELPIRQDLAVTGSVSQHGEVQAIGGVNEKIEGFFDLCAARGLRGTEGVLVPASNAKHLMLRQDVVRAVEEGRFHVYAVRHVDEGIELLTGVPAGARDEGGAYPEGSVNRRIEDRLDAMTRRIAALARDERGEPTKP